MNEESIKVEAPNKEAPVTKKEAEAVTIEVVKAVKKAVKKVAAPKKAPAKPVKKPAKKAPAPKKPAKEKKPAKKAKEAKLPELSREVYELRRRQQERTAPSLQSIPVKQGPAAKVLAKRIKTKLEPGVCWLKGCQEEAKVRWCPKHQKEVRKLQLKLNNQTWQKRVKAGKAGHHILYRGKASAYTVENLKSALAASKGGRGIAPPEYVKAVAAVASA